MIEPPKKCYAKGSVSPGFFDKELQICECLPGYMGPECNECMPFHENEGTEKEPVCSCKGPFTLCHQ